MKQLIFTTLIAVLSLQTACSQKGAGSASGVETPARTFVAANLMNRQTNEVRNIEGNTLRLTQNGNSFMLTGADGSVRMLPSCSSPGQEPTAPGDNIPMSGSTGGATSADQPHLTDAEIEELMKRYRDAKPMELTVDLSGSEATELVIDSECVISEGAEPSVVSNGNLVIFASQNQ